MKLTHIVCTLVWSPLVCCGNAIAADALWHGHLNGQIGARTDNDKIKKELQAGNFIAPSFTTDDNPNTGFKLYAGRRWSRNFALEWGHFYLGEYRFTATAVSPPGVLTGATSPRGLILDALGFLPITEKLSAMGRVGIVYADSKNSFAGSGSIAVVNPDPGKYETS